MEKKRLIVTALVLVAAIAIAIFLTKDYWWPFFYYNYVLPSGGPRIPSYREPEKIVAFYEGNYSEKIFTAETASSDYPEPWLANKNLLNGYSRLYSAIAVGMGTGRHIAEGTNNQTIVQLYAFKYKNEKIAKEIYEKSGLEDTEITGSKIKHGLNKYVWQSNEFIVYIASAEGFKYVAKEKMYWIMVRHLPE